MHDIDVGHAWLSSDPIMVLAAALIILRLHRHWQPMISHFTDRDGWMCTQTIRDTGDT